MTDLREERLSGIDAVNMVTKLLQRVRNTHPTEGMYQAAEVEFWWANERSTDTLDQLFWFDEDGQPRAAAVITDFSGARSLLYTEPTLAIHVMPNESAELLGDIVDRALSHAAEAGMDAVELEVDRDDVAMIDIVSTRGFTKQGPAVVECWLDADQRPEVSELHEGYRLFARSELMADKPHHLSNPDRPNVESRLQETSLYRSDLDLVIVDENGETAAFCIFWNDPGSETGVVEPMRTHDEHQKRGLARHLLTAGVDLLAAAGAKRISIGYEPDNPASGHLYRSVGFEPVHETDVYAGPTKQPS